MQYQSLEPDSLKSLGVNNTPSFGAGADVSFFATTSFLYTLFFVAIIGASFYRYMVAGILRMQASDTAIRQSNDIIKKTTLGLLGVFSLFLILVTFNKDLVTGDVGLSGLASRGITNTSVATTPVAGSGSGSGSVSASCLTKDLILQKLQSGNVCAGTTCAALTGCSYQQYLPIIEANTFGDSQLKKMIIVTMCRESKARPDASNKNPNGTYDCGLMQINQPTPCETNPPASSQEANIKLGIQKMKQKLSGASQTYANVPALGGAFASYNCCANGTIPNSPSADCTQAAGFPLTVPKWVCPINPGDSTYNMCVVKNYACDLTTCMGQL